MAEIPPPNGAKTTRAKVVGLKATEQASPTATKPLQFNIPETIRNDFKSFVALKGKAGKGGMSELFLEMYAEYKENHPVS